jgi:hypothetical protein
MRHAICLSLVILLVGSGLWAAPETPAEDIAKRLGLAPDTAIPLQELATSPPMGFDEVTARLHAPDILRLEAAHVGGQRLVFKTTFAYQPDFASSIYIIYLDLDNDPKTGRVDPHHGGVDVMVSAGGDRIAAGLHNLAYSTQNTTTRGVIEGPVLWISLDAPLQVEGGQVKFGVHLLSQREGGRSDSTPHQSVALPFSAATVPPLPTGRDTSLRALSEYRYHDDKVKLEKLSDKGLRRAQVMSATPFKPGRERPVVPFLEDTTPVAFSGLVARRQVPLELLEESGQDRAATPLRCGFPLPQGGIVSPGNVRLLGAGGREIPAQVTATARWPEGSLKWVLIESLVPLKAKERQELQVEFGQQVRRQAPPQTLQIDEAPGVFTITTGPLQAVVDRQRFNLLRSVARDANGNGRFEAGEQLGGCSPDGVRLVDEQGKVFSMAALPPDSLRWEQRGPLVAVLRAEGAYGSADGNKYMRYLARLTFRAGSARVDLALTHINDALENEFSDFTALELPLVPAGGGLQAEVYLADQAGKLQAHRGARLGLFQADELSSSLQVDDRKLAGEKAPGVMQWRTDRGAVTAVVHEFWQRWPKGLRAEGGAVVVDLLPTQPGPDYGQGLPHYLLYPFVEGKYRLKWGMAFTERLTLDYGGTPAAEVYAEAAWPLVAVVPATWLAETGALGPLAAPLGQQFALRDKIVADSYRAHLDSRDRTREYGFLNYGDWYGERARNWGNNEYDFAHGFFMQYARTGNRDYYRLALAHARHQADVDIVHAYPDPYYIGGNHPHSIGHTGSWTETSEHGTWSHRYDSMTSAANGHTWADGMVDAWCLAGEPRVMESALALGEHIVWGMSQTFKALGTHERTAGWSLRAIMALHRATSDPLYLEAAARIAAVPVREQKLDRGGSWPHILPRDHAGGHPNAEGNNTFLIGVLLGGLKTYHEEAGDAAVEKALKAGVAWLAKSWSEEARGWPYSASTTGEPYYQAGTSLNMLIIEPVAYVAKLTGDPKLWHIVAESFEAVAGSGGDSFGKANAQKMFFSSGLMALLQEHLRSQPDQGANFLSGDEEWLARYLARTPAARNHAVRAPDEKVFFVQLKGDRCELIATRQPHGAMNKRAEHGTITITAGGKTVTEDRFSTDLPHEFRTPLTGKIGDIFRVVINDDQRGIWNLSGDKLGIVMQAGADFRIGGVGRGRYSFFVPAGTKEFTIKLVGVHAGSYGAVVLGPDGRMVGSHQDANPGQALIPGAPKVNVPAADRQRERGQVTIKPAAAETGKLWSVILFAALDLGVELEGIPPYLSLNPDAWFEVK